MEWLGVLLLYLISGFLKKRQQDQKRKVIESDPDWDNGDIVFEKESSNNLEQLFNNIFEQNINIPSENSKTNESLDLEHGNFQLDESVFDTDESLEESTSLEKGLTTIDNQREKFEENIYHSKLAEREELHLGNKWLKHRNIKDELFKSRQSLRRSIIIKEILDKPLGMRS